MKKNYRLQKNDTEQGRPLLGFREVWTATALSAAELETSSARMRACPRGERNSSELFSCSAFLRIEMAVVCY